MMKLFLATSSSLFTLVLGAVIISSGESFNVQPNTWVAGRRKVGQLSSKSVTATTTTLHDDDNNNVNVNVLGSQLFGHSSGTNDKDAMKFRSSSSTMTSSSSSKMVWSALSVVVLALYRILIRTDTTLDRAGFNRNNMMTAGIGSSVTGLVRKVKLLPEDAKKLTLKDLNPIKIIKFLHGPVTYMVLAVLAANKYKWMWKNPAWWFGIAFCVKWFRARYVFKIPVWDRQPNWNNVITSKEQEKDLKAFTCKNCGSTIFIAKTREFFFEGQTGIGGLGCFSCGAKGADNFVMDRDRIVEDVSDMDDYFEYERPLDFITAAERRKLMKEAGGDEDMANQILIDRTNAQASEESQAQADAIVNGGSATFDSSPAVSSDETEENTTASSDGEVEEISPPPPDATEPVKASSSAPVSSSEPIKKTTKKKKKKKAEKKAVPSTPPNDVDDDLDALDMDAF
mmetsp:Transcript_4940/g.12543  ORF Transcript_4940/g.12543 Transcript_4940/m.12543 type:complete len:454 (-) Transcript_4940:194-1555(-)